MRVGFDQASDISKVFLALARPAARIEDRPNFALQNILNSGDWQLQPENLAYARPYEKRFVSGIGLDLDSQSRAAGGDVKTVRKPLDRKLIAEHSRRSRELIHGDDHIKIKTDDGLYIRVDPLPAEHTKSNVMLR